MQPSSSSSSFSTDEGSAQEKSSLNSGRHKRKRRNQSRSRDATNKSPSETLFPPIVVNGVVEFALAPVSAQLTCKLCRGYYRDPYTIAECLHTFCKSCLFSDFAKGNHKCPECNVDLGTDPFRSALADRTIQELVDKVLFPRLRVQEEEREKDFYEKRGIKLKPEFQEEKDKRTLRSDEPSQHTIRHSAANDVLDLTLMPECVPEGEYPIPSLDRPCIQTSGRLKIIQLKKYLLNQLHITGADPSLVEILCNGGPVGNELSLTFVQRTIWLRPKEDLMLTYRFADE